MKNNVKKILLTLSAVVLMSVIFCFNAGATNSEILREGYYTYTVKDSKATIESVNGYLHGNVEIPSRLGGYPVVAIESNAFSNSERISKIIIPETIEFISPKAFLEMYSLYAFDVSPNNAFYSVEDGVLYNKDKTKIVLFPEGRSSAYVMPQSVREIGPYAFYNSRLSSFTINSSVTSIGDYAFAYAKYIREIVIPESVTYIGQYAFFRAEKLESVSVTDKTEYIGCGAFADSYWWNQQKKGPVYLGKVLLDVKDSLSEGNSLTVKEGTVCISRISVFLSDPISSISIPDSVKYIEDGVLGKCSYLTSVNLDEKNPYFCYEDNILFNSDKTRILWASYLISEELVLPDTVKTVDINAFSMCQNIKEITFPESIERIGLSAFPLINSIEKVNISSLKDWLEVEFEDDLSNPICGNKADLYIGGSKLTDLIIPDGITEIKEYAFFGCSSITSLTSGDDLTHIGREAFSDCKNLAKIDLQKGNVRVLKSGAFNGCEKLTELDAPFVVRIENSWDDCCESIEKINLPSLLYAHLSDFENTKWFDNQNDGIIYIGNMLLGYKGENPGNTVIEIKDGIISIADAALSDQKNIVSVTFPNSLKHIGYAVFYGCTGLKNITVPSAVTELGESIFENCTSLETVVLPDEMAIIGSSAFENCTSLVKMDFPEKLRAIGMAAFRDCTNLSEVTFSVDVDYIDLAAFSNCSSELTVNYEGTVEQWENVLRRDSMWYKYINYHYGKPHTEEILPSLEPTCTSEGITEGKVCIACQKITLEQQTIPSYGHSFDIETIIEEPSCGENPGKKLLECSRCHITTTEGIPPLKHARVVIPGKAPTCTEEGLTEGEKCSVCGDISVVQTTIKALGHTIEWIDPIPGTCTEPGMTGGSKCSVCGEILEAPQVDTDLEGHSYHTVTVKEATCFEDGLDVEKCDKCGDVSEERIIPKLNHDSVYFEHPKSATCTEDGTTEGIMCDKCNTVLKEPEIIKAYGHQFITMPVKPATCTENGIEQVICFLCHTVSEEKVIPAKGHGEIGNGRMEPTCTEDGRTDEIRCDKCNIVLKESEIIPKKGHREVPVEGKNPTCTDDGLTDGINCADCGTDLVMQEIIPAKGHTEVVIPAVSATYKKSGKTKGVECSVCGEILVAQKKTSRKKLSKVKSLKVKKTTSNSVTLSWKKVTGAESYKVYYSTDGKKWKSVKVTKNSATVKKLKAAKNYQFKVRAFAGKYYGEASKVVKTSTKFTATTLTKVNSTKKKQTTVTWKKVKNASGYVVEYSTSKNFTKKTTKTVTVKKGKTTKITLKKLKSGKKYYVRVKAFKTVNKKTVYSEYSKVKTVKVK